MINIKRDTSNPPLGLAKEKQKEINGGEGNYRCEDVVSRIKYDFYNKCYICESPKPTSINVEHFLPHLGGTNIDLKFDFSNLFYACQHCNNCKSGNFDNILNCTDDNEDVEMWIELFVELVEGSRVKISITPQGENSGNRTKVENTIHLLERIYNGEHTAIKTEESDNLRNFLIDEMWVFYGNIRKLMSNIRYPQEQKESEEFIRLNVRNDSNFTGFKRWVIRRNKNLKAFESFFV